jgi:hypothetical protein
MYLQDLLARYNARLVPIIIEIKVTGEVAVQYGWHELTLTPKCGGEPVATRTRYIDVWRKDKAGNWRLAMLIDNADVSDQVDTARLQETGLYGRLFGSLLYGRRLKLAGTSNASPSPMSRTTLRVPARGRSEPASG